MIAKPKTSSAPSAATPARPPLRHGRRRQATTLVEVVAALALLAALLVGLLLAKARLTRQAALADRRLQAVSVADTLLSTWRSNSGTVPRTGNGSLADDLSWRTRPIPNPAAHELGADVVRLEIVDDRPAASEALLTSMEVLVEPQNQAVAPPIPPQQQSTGSKRGKPKSPKIGNNREKSVHHP